MCHFRSDYLICDQQQVDTLEIMNHWSNLYSPNYNYVYNNLDECGLQIYSANGVVVLEIVYLDLDESYANVVVYDGADEQNKLLTTLTGKIAGVGKIMSSGQYLYIKYNSNNSYSYSLTKSGFHLRLTSGWSTIKLFICSYIYQGNFTVSLCYQLQVTVTCLVMAGLVAVPRT